MHTALTCLLQTTVPSPTSWGLSLRAADWGRKSESSERQINTVVPMFSWDSGIRQQQEIYRTILVLSFCSHWLSQVLTSAGTWYLSWWFSAGPSLVFSMWSTCSVILRSGDWLVRNNSPFVSKTPSFCVCLVMSWQNISTYLCIHPTAVSSNTLNVQVCQFH